jgi:hypothetical protein
MYGRRINHKTKLELLSVENLISRTKSDVFFLSALFSKTLLLIQKQSIINI